MIRSKDLFLDQQIRDEIEKTRLQRLGTEAYLTIRKERVITGEVVKPKTKKK